VEKAIIKDCYRRGHPLPKKIANAPRLFFGLELFLTAYLDLESERPVGWDLCPIPRSSMVAYAKEHGIEGEQFDDLLCHVTAMDLAYRKYEDKRQKRKK
jgi:hypothetical protein